MRRASDTSAATSSPATAAMAIQRVRLGVMAVMVDSMGRAVAGVAPPTTSSAGSPDRPGGRDARLRPGVCRPWLTGKKGPARRHRVRGGVSGASDQVAGRGVTPVGRPDACTRSATRSDPSSSCSARCSTCRTRPLWSPCSYRPDARTCSRLPPETSFGESDASRFQRASSVERLDGQRRHGTGLARRGWTASAAPALSRGRRFRTEE